MIFEPEKSDIPELSSLWQLSFGDEAGYIALFFDELFEKAKALAYRCDGKIVSALYLLPCSLVLDGKAYSGRYIYAAATLPEYRRKGIMGKLLNEGYAKAVSDGCDFLSLVPGEPELTDYYAKFGYINAMSRGRAAFKLADVSESSVLPVTPLSAQQAYALRQSLLGDTNRHDWSENELSYALSSFSYYGGKAYRVGDCFVICTDNEADGLVLCELLDGELTQAVYTLLLYYKKSACKAFMPYQYNYKSESFGMIKPINASVGSFIADKRNIYMNIALD